MYPHVYIEIPFDGELFVTNCAVVWLLACMGSYVPFQYLFLLKPFSAMPTWELSVLLLCIVCVYKGGRFDVIYFVVHINRICCLVGGLVMMVPI